MGCGEFVSELDPNILSATDKVESVKEEGEEEKDQSSNLKVTRRQHYQR